MYKCAAYFTFNFIVYYSKEKKRVEFLLVCVKLAFLKTTGCFFLVGFNYINPEDNYGHLIDFLRQISKLSYFNVLDLAEFMMYQ